MLISKSSSRNEIVKNYTFIAVLILLIVGLIFLFKNSEQSLRSKTSKAYNYSFATLVDGLERTTIVHVPPNYDGVAVLVLHGGGESAQSIMLETGWADKSDQEGFLAVFPEGTSPDSFKLSGARENQQTWGDGSGRFHHKEQNIDDVAFINMVIDTLLSQFGANEQRIFVTGFSNGASMTFRLGVELSGRIAAIAPVAGALWAKDPILRQPVSLLYMSGTKDQKPQGGEVMFGTKRLEINPPAQNPVLAWVEMLDCPLRVKSVPYEDGVTGTAYGPCRQESRVVSYTIEELGHVWPGGKTFFELSLENTVSTLNATDVIWEFFNNTQNDFIAR